MVRAAQGPEWLVHNAEGMYAASGWKSTGRRAWTMSFRTRTLPARVGPLACPVGGAMLTPYPLPVEQFVKKGRLPHLLFYGPPGALTTGKPFLYRAAYPHSTRPQAPARPRRCSRSRGSSTVQRHTARTSSS